MILREACWRPRSAASLGVVLGVLVMRLFKHSLVYYLETVGVPFVWLGTPLLSRPGRAHVVLSA